MLSVRKLSILFFALALVGVGSTPLGAAPLLGTKGAGDDADKWLLSEPEAVMTINIKQIIGSDIFKANRPKVKEMIDHSEGVKTLLEAAGLDPFKDVDSILISSAGGTGRDAKAQIVIKGRFDTDKIHTALKKEAEKKDKIEAVKEGDQQLYQIKLQDQVLWAGFASKSVLVMTHNKENTVDALKHGGTKSAKIGKEMRTALGKFTGKESLTFAMVISDDLKKQFDKAPPQVGKAASKLQTLTASLTVNDAVDLNITGNTSEEKAAKQLSGGLALLKVAAGGLTEDLPPIVGKVLDEVKISAEKESVVIALKLTKAMIDEARKLGGDK
jgi:hypothetical protein